MTEPDTGTAFDMVIKGGRVFDPGAGVDRGVVARSAVCAGHPWGAPSVHRGRTLATRAI